MSDSSELHVVFGAGQVGPVLARRLVAQGKRVRLVRRSTGRVALDGVELVRADASDPAAASEAARGAAAVYHCLNPATYSARAWAAELPRIQASLIQAATSVGARLVVLNNLYALGRTGGEPMTEATALKPCSKKGEIRARLHEALEAAVARGEVRAVTGRASDFYGPGGVGTHFADRFWKPVLAGKTPAGVVNPDTPHTYHYIPDVAAGLAALGADPAATGTYNLPCQPAVSTRELARRLAAAAGREVGYTRMSPVAMKLLAWVMPILRELDEMAYQWEAPFIVDDTKFRQRFGALVTPTDEAAQATFEWGRATFGPSAG